VLLPVFVSFSWCQVKNTIKGSIYLSYLDCAGMTQSTA
jgi:hypothetical protein